MFDTEAELIAWICRMTRDEILSAVKSGEDMRGTNLNGANLHGADLSGADLSGADLHGANLNDANLDGANFGDQWIIQGPTRSDGYTFFLQRLTQDQAPKVKAGCRYLTIAKARAHWQKTRNGTPLGSETFIILDYLEAMAAARGLS
jgi:Pentapeptide repeats (8 copies)